MKKINTYSIQRQQQMFNLPVSNKDFFFVEISKNSLFYPEPRRSETYSISYLKTGAVFLQAGLTTQRVEAPAIITLGPTVVRTIQEDPDMPAVMEMLFFKANFLLANHTNVFYLMGFRFFEKEELHSCPLTATEAERTQRVFELVKNTLKAKHVNEPQMVRSCIFLLINEADAFHRAQGKNSADVAESQSPLVANFKTLLLKEYRKHREVQFYAGKLNITPKHLSEQLKKYTGRTAGEWIDEAIILESKVLLQNRSFSVAEISGQLSFGDQSVFGKFFRAQTGLTPLEYRKTTLS